MLPVLVETTFTSMVEADIGGIKKVIGLTLGVLTMKTAAAAIKGLKIMRLIRPGHCLTCKPACGVRAASRIGIFEVAAALSSDLGLLHLGK